MIYNNTDVCKNCSNNPKNNPFASGICSCALPYMTPPTPNNFFGTVFTSDTSTTVPVLSFNSFSTSGYANIAEDK